MNIPWYIHWYVHEGFAYMRQKDQKEKRVVIGVAGMLVVDGKVLMNLRNKPIGKGLWDLPAGALEFGESLEECLVREFKEETGLGVEVRELVSVAPNTAYGNHHVMFTFAVDALDPDSHPQLLEPKNHQKWEWFDLNNLPENLFVTVENAFKDLKANKIYQPSS